MQSPNPDNEYYAITVLGSEEGQQYTSTQTQFVRFDDSDCKVEIRKGAVVQPDVFIEHWTTLKQPYLVVDVTSDLPVFVLLGGHGLIETSIAKQHFAHAVDERPVVQTGPSGFTSSANVPDTAFNRAPTPKLRMRILKRDDYRCRLCGLRITLTVNCTYTTSDRGVVVA